MMTQEEVAQVIAYCEENRVSYKQRLDELGIATWMFYDAKRKYAPKPEADNAGDFLQLVPGGTFFPSPIKPARSRGRRQKDAEQEAAPVNIELKTATGTMMHRILPRGQLQGYGHRPAGVDGGCASSHPQQETNHHFLRELLPDKRAMKSNYYTN